MEQKFEFTGNAALIVLVLVLIGVGIRFATFSDSQDTELEKAVRSQLWINYGGRLGKEIEHIRGSADYDKVPALLEKASPDAITIERISRSEPLLSLSSKEKVIIRVDYRYPDDTETRAEYMYFKHGAIGGWSYRYDSTPIAYYLNFF